MFLTVDQVANVMECRERWKKTFAISRFELERGSLWFVSDPIEGWHRPFTTRCTYQPGDAYLVRDYDGNVLLDLKVH